MADKRVTVQVDTDVNDSEVKAIDEELRRLKMQQLQLKIDANKSELEEVENRIQNIKTFLNTANTGDVHFRVDDELIEKAQAELKALESQSINLKIAVADDELTQAKDKEEALNGSAKFNIDVNDSAAQQAMQNIQDGINQTKQGLGELANGFGEVLTAAGSADQNQAFLEIGYKKSGKSEAEAKKLAKEAQGTISEAVAQAPGDDTAMNSILSSAVAKDVKLMDKDMQGFANSVADYFAGAEVNGKHAAEAIQDVRSYITSGNVAELQTTGVFDDKQLDELKDIDSVSDRVAKFQEMIDKSSYAGLGTADTLNKTMGDFDGMVAKSATSLGGFFTDATKGAADLFLAFNDLTGGLAGMGLVALQEFGPGLFSIAQGLLIMVPGIQALGGLSGIFGMLKGGVMGLASSFMGLSIAGAPLWAIIAAVIALGVAIFEVGKAFGWWSDFGTMLDAIKTGVMELWNAFTSNTYVVQIVDLIKQGLTDAWNAIVGFGQAIWTALSGGATGGFDILGFMINNLNMILNAVGPLILMAIQGIIQGFRNVYTAAQFAWPYVASAVSTAVGIASGVINAGRSVFMGLVSVWNTLSGAVQTMASTIQSALNAAGSAWNSFKSTVMNAVQPILDAANQVGDAVGGALSAIGFGGIETPTVNTGGYNAGYTNVSQGNTIIFNMYGDVKDEKTIDDMIDAINNRVQYEALANGTATDSNGGMI